MTKQLVHTLDNGLVVLGEPTASFESVAFQLTMPAGCIYESADQAGLASLTCEQMLRGAGTRDNRALVNEFEKLGVERGESVGVAQASFSAALLAENLEPALALYADVVRRPRMPEGELEASKAVCQQEIAGLHDDPSHLLMSELRKRYYPEPWGRASHGREEVIEAATHDDTLQFYNTRYQPSGAILSVAGNFEWSKLLPLVERQFGDWKGASPIEVSLAEPAIVPQHMPYESNQSHIGIAFSSVPYSHPQYFEAWGAIGILSSGMSSRLFTEVREKRGLCYTVYASQHNQRDRAAVFCYAGTTNERAQETLDVTHGELVRLAKGIEPGELSRLKARIKSALIMQQESTSARAGSMARDWYLLGRIRPIEEISAIIDDLEADAINAYLTAHPPANFVAMTLGPQPLEMPHGVS